MKYPKRKQGQPTADRIVVVRTKRAFKLAGLGAAAKATAEVLRYGWWVGALAAIHLSVQGTGLPHLRWQYEYYARPSGPHYVACDYVGPYGVGRVHPADGQCPVFAFFRGRPGLRS